MHSSLTLRQLASRKAALLAQSAQIRRELQRDAACLQPVAATIDLALNILRQVKRCHAVTSNLSGLAQFLFTGKHTQRSVESRQPTVSASSRQSVFKA